MDVISNGSKGTSLSISSLIKMETLKKWFILTFFLFSLEVLLRSLFLGFYPDFSVYYYATKAHIEGLNPYSQGLNLFAPFMYPPTLLPIFYPFVNLSYNLAEKIWVVLSLLLLFPSLFLLSKLFKQKIFSHVSLFLYSLVFLSFPLKFTLGMGQINTFILLLVILFLYFLEKKRLFLSGIFLGLAIAFKLFPLLLIPYLIIRKKGKIVISILITILSISTYTYFSVKAEIIRDFFKEVIPIILSPWNGGYYNQALSGTLVKFFEKGNYHSTQIILSLVLVFVSFFIILQNKTKEVLTIFMEIGLIITTSLLVNNFSWQHHFLWLIVPFFAMFFYIRKKNLKRIYYLVLGISYLLVSTNLRYPSLHPSLVQSHVFFGTLMLWLINLQLLKLRK